MSRILFKLVFDILDNFFPIHLQDVPIVFFFFIYCKWHRHVNIYKL